MNFCVTIKSELIVIMTQIKKLIALFDPNGFFENLTHIPPKDIPRNILTSDLLLYVVILSCLLKGPSISSLFSDFLNIYSLLNYYKGALKNYGSVFFVELTIPPLDQRFFSRDIFLPVTFPPFENCHRHLGMSRALFLTIVPGMREMSRAIIF